MKRLILSILFGLFLFFPFCPLIVILLGLIVKINLIIYIALIFWIINVFCAYDTYPGTFKKKDKK